MDLGVIIVSYNTRQLTLDCLASLYRALDDAKINGHVWVVDNASSDDSASAVQVQYPQATCLVSSENLGFARGINLGLDRIKALDKAPPLVLLLNPDTIVTSQALAALSDFVNRHPNVAVAGPQLSYGDGTFQHSAFRFPTLLMAFFDFWTINHRLIHSSLNGRYAPRCYRTGEPFQVDHPLGAAMMLRWEALQDVGQLDPNYFMYCEEIDWCIRAKRLGWDIYCVPKARIVHLEGQSARQFRDRMFVALWRSRFQLFSKHYGALYRFVVRRIVRAGLRRELRRVECDLDLQRISADVAARRQAAYQQVMEL